MSNDANQKGSLEEEGFVSDNADVPCRGHLGFFAVFKGEVNYADLVERGRELGLPGYSGPSLGEDRSAAHSHGDNGHLHWGLNGNRWDWSSLSFDWDGWIPRPRSGSKAFANAVKDLNWSVGFVKTEDWEDAQGRRQARVSYEVVMLRNNKEFKLVRRWRGKNVASGRWDSITEDLFRIQFVPPERGSHLQRWRQRYVHQTLTGNPPKDMPRAEPSELSALYEVTPFDASVSVSPEQIQQVNRTLRLALLRECTTVDQDGLRSIIRRAIKDVGGMQFGGSSGGVYYIPDWNNTQHYMQALVPFSELINWFGEQNYQVEEYVEDEDGSWVRQQHSDYLAMLKVLVRWNTSVRTLHEKLFPQSTTTTMTSSRLSVRRRLKTFHGKLTDYGASNERFVTDSATCVESSETASTKHLHLTLGFKQSLTSG